MPLIFENLTSNANTAAFAYPGGKSLIDVFGTFDTCSVTIQRRLDPTGEWVPFGVSAWTAALGVEIDLAPCDIRFVVASVGGSTDVDIAIKRFR